MAADLWCMVSVLTTAWAAVASVSWYETRKRCEQLQRDVDDLNVEVTRYALRASLTEKGVHCGTAD